MLPVIFLISLLAQAPAPMPTPHPVPGAPASGIGSGYVPERVYDTRAKAFADFESMVADLARADVVFVGEQHDDPNTHRLEAAILEGLLRRKSPAIVSLEMFERDTQAALDAYLAGTLGEEEFLKDARPWPRYGSDYRPLVELARAHQWPVVAANVPRRIASEIAKSGQSALDGRSESERALAARDIQCPRDGYFDRFAEQMSSHPAPGQDAKAASEMTERFYLSQCVKDETMAESIVAAFEAPARRAGPVVHYNGAFHSDFGLGTAARVVRRLPRRRVVIVSMLPVSDLDAVAPEGEELRRADYLVYTIRR